MVNSWTIHEHSCFKKNGPFAFRLSPSVSSSPFLSLPLFLSLSFGLFVFWSLCLFVFWSLRLLVSLSLCLFVFLSLCLFVSLSLCLFVSSSFLLSFPLFLSFFNVHPANPANYLKTKELRKRHFWLKILSPGKPLRLKALGEKFTQWSAHLPADPTLHTRPKLTLHAPPRNPTSCKVLCRICRPNPTHLTPLIIKS